MVLSTIRGVDHENVPNIVGQISSAFGEAGINIIDLLNKSRGDFAYTLVDADTNLPPTILERIRAIKGVLSARIV
ncbi:MAG: ACT domain-containing protein [Methylococcales bacterium]